MKQILQLKNILKKIENMLRDIKEIKAKWTQRQAIGKWEDEKRMKKVLWHEALKRANIQVKIENAKVHIAHYEKW